MALNAIFNTFKTKFATIPGIKNIEWYLGQDTAKGGFSITPTLLIKFSNVVPKQLSKTQQSIDLSIELQLYTDYKKANEKMADENTHPELHDAIFNIMIGYEQTAIETMQRKAGLIYSSQTFRCVIVKPLPKKTFLTINKSTITPKIS